VVSDITERLSAMAGVFDDNFRPGEDCTLRVSNRASNSAGGLGLARCENREVPALQEETCEFRIRPHEGRSRYSGRPTRRTISLNLGSGRMGSQAMKLFRDGIELSRSAKAFSSQANARSFSPSTP
jgi:hypothetical protein